MMCRWLGVVVSLAASGSAATTQQTLEVGRDGGREVAGGPEYSFGPNGVVDYGRRLVLVTEAADPRAVKAYSLDDGSVRAVFGGGRAGEGPGELTRVWATAVAPNGVFVAGTPDRVLHWSWSGALLPQWTPPATPVSLCVLNGRPAFPSLRKGVVFRGDDGENVWLGGEAGTVPAMEDAMAYLQTKIACADSVAYVLAGTEHVITEYKLGAEPRVFELPAEFLESARKKAEVVRRRLEASGGRVFTTVYDNLFLASDGRLVATMYLDEMAGVVVDPATECHALLKRPPGTDGAAHVGMFADSVVSMEAGPPTMREMNGRQVPVLDPSPTHIFLRPVRSVSGEACP